MKKIHDLTQKAVGFSKTDVWRIRIETLPFFQAATLKFTRVLLVSAKNFQKYQCPIRASALTFYTLLSIVPVAAMAFGIAAGFGFEQRLEKELLMIFSGQEAVVAQIIGFAHSLLSNTQGGLIAGVGVAVLFYTVIKVLGNIEDSLNAIWEVARGRSIGRKIGDYLGMMILAPVLMIMAGSTTVFIETQVKTMAREISIVGAFGPLIVFGLKLLPYLLVWILFSVIYRVMPNTRVRIASAVTAGVIAGTLYQLLQWGYITFQVGVAKNNAVYGSFAALPLFLAWLQLSWLVVLFGAVISSAWQHAEEFQFDPACPRPSIYLDRLIYLGVVRWLVMRFREGLPPSTPREIADALSLPVSIVRKSTSALAAAGILANVRHDAGMSSDDNAGHQAFQPGRDIGLLTVKAVVDAMEHRGCDVDSMPTAPALDGVSAVLAEMDRAAEASPGSAANRLLKDVP